MKILILLILLLSGCVTYKNNSYTIAQSDLFSRDCSLYNDLEAKILCYKEKAYMYAAIRDEANAIANCRSIYAVVISNFVNFSQLSGTGIFEFNNWFKLISDKTEILPMFARYNNCIINVARISRNKAICKYMLTLNDIKALGFTDIILRLTPLVIVSQSKCERETDFLIIRDQQVGRDFFDYIK